MSERVLVASIAGQDIALPAEEAQSVVDIRSLTPVPHAPDRVAGLAGLRSLVLTVIDCRRAAGVVSASTTNGLGRAIVVVVDGHHYALMVDRVSDVTERLDEIQPVPSHIDAGWAAVARGMVDSGAGLLLVIDVNAMIFGANHGRAF